MTKKHINIRNIVLKDMYPNASDGASKFKSPEVSQGSNPRKHKDTSRLRGQENTQDMSSFVWEIQESMTGAKSAFLQLKERMRSPEVTKDIADLIDRKAYTILTPKMQGTLDNALETFKVSDIGRVPRRNIYCLLLESTVYVFFWRKSSI